MDDLTPAKDAALQKAIEIVGSISELARLLNIHRQAVSQWRRVPPSRAFEVSELTRGKVTLRELLKGRK